MTERESISKCREDIARVMRILEGLEEHADDHTERIVIENTAQNAKSDCNAGASVFVTLWAMLSGILLGMLGTLWLEKLLP